MAFKNGEVSGSVTAKQLPSIRYDILSIRAQSSNTGNVYLGGAGVVKPSGVTGTSAGFGLAAGDVFWFTTPGNLGDIYIICDNVTDDIEYIAQQ